MLFVVLLFITILFKVESSAINEKGNSRLRSIPHYQRNRALALASSAASGAHSSTRRRHREMISSWNPPRHTQSPAPPFVVYPVDFGADPTGILDSTDAFSKAIKSLLAHNTSGHTDEGGTYDLGGAMLDLEGGDYLISAPIVVPSNYSNLAIAHGTLRASVTFPVSRFVIEVGEANAYCVNWGNSCNENIDFEDLLIDGNQVAAGCMVFYAVIGVNAGPDIFCVNFTTTGIDMEGGHEVELHESWIGSCWYTPPSLCWLNASALGKTTGVLINGNDHLLNQVVVFAGLSGVVVNGAANIITTTHTWNTQLGSVADSVGIQINSWQNRLVSPYLDYVPFICKGCAVTTMTSAFFLCAQAQFIPDPNGYPVSSIYISGSEFACLGNGESDFVALSSSTNYTGVQDVTIVGSLTDNPNSLKRSTQSQLSITGPSTTWTFDFSTFLLFPLYVAPIRSIQYSISSTSGTSAPFSHYAYIEGFIVKIISDTKDVTTNFTVSALVDQSLRLAGGVA
jgi:hypothetical protein